MKSKDHLRLHPFIYKMAAGILIFAGVFFAAMIFGAADTTIHDIWLAVSSKVKTENVLVLREIRFPREVAAVFTGAALAVAGAVMQGLTRNPLADPGLLGLTAGANAALTLTLAFLPSVSYLGITASCFIGAAAGTFMVFGIGSMRKGGYSPLRIVLAGAAVSAFLYAIAEGISLYFKLSKDVSMWTSAGLIGTSWKQLYVIVPVILIGIAVSLFLSKQLTVLSLHEEVAAGLGQNIARVKMILFIVIILLAGASVALAGNMAFIGLIVPHVVRAIVGVDYRFIIPMSSVCGAIIMLLADTLGRTLASPYEISVAAIAAVMGLPFFLVIVRKGGKAFS